MSEPKHCHTDDGVAETGSPDNNELLREVQALRAERDTLKVALHEERTSQIALAKVCERAGLVYWTWSAKSRLISFGLHGGALLAGEASPVGILPSAYEELFKRIHPDDVETVEAVYRQADTAGEDFQLEYRVYGQDGDLRHVREFGIAEFDALGTFLGHVGATEDITELKQAEAARRTSEASFREFFESANLAILRVSVDGEILEANERFCEMLGYSHAEIRGMNVKQVTDPEDLDQTTENLRRFTAGETDSLVHEKRYRHKNGGIVWGLLSARIRHDAAGKPRYFVAAIQDITEQKLAQTALRDREVLLQGLIDAAPFVISVKDTEGRFLYTNRFLLDFYGYEGAGLVGKTLTELFPEGADNEELRRKIQDDDAQVIASGKAIPFFEDEVSIDGRTRSVYVTKVPLADSSGANKYVATIAIDISDRKASEDALRRSEERFRVLFENAPDASMLFDPQTTKFVDVNDSAVRLFGLPRERLLEIGPLELSPEIQPDGTPSVAVAQRNIEAALRGEIPQFEWMHFNADGCEVLCEIRLARLEFDDRVLVRGSAMDISHRKAIEEQLRQSQKMEAVGHMTGGVAHDFNNLLGVIIGNLELAAERLGEDQSTLNLVERAVGAATRGAKTTQQLLAFSRRQPLQSQATDIMELLVGMTDMLRRSLGETIHLDVHGDRDLWFCEVDPGQMESCVLNLALNAADAMPEGGRLAVHLRNVTLGEEAHVSEVEPGDYVRFSVTDSGAGMPPEVKARAFEPFFTTKEVGRGTGLGLSMVYGFARQSGGCVTIDSELGCGTTFELFLPRAARDSESLRPGDRDLPRAKDERVLVVEDDAELRDLAVRILSDLGYRVESTVDAPAALQRLGSGEGFDLLLTDLILPSGMNGRELGDQVVRDHPEIRILFMSGYTQSTIVHDGRLEENVQLLQKPFRRAELARAVRSALDAEL